MVGDGGDSIYEAREYWLRDVLIREGMGAFLRSAGAVLKKSSQGDVFAKTSLRRLVPLRNARRFLGRRHPAWLTRQAADFLAPNSISPIVPSGGQKYRFDLSVGAKNIELESEERMLFVQCGVRRCNPFWNWPLLESALNLPAYWYHLDGTDKVLAREALEGYLPQAVINGGEGGLLGSLFLHGLMQNQEKLKDMVFSHPQSDWKRFVDEAWLSPFLSQLETVTFGHTILWRVICYEFWCSRLFD